MNRIVSEYWWYAGVNEVYAVGIDVGDATESAEG